MSRWRKIGHVFLHELREVIPPTVFFFLGFNLILFTKRLFLADYLIAYAGFFVATTGALIVGKVVLVADKMPLLRRFDSEPLAYPILFKTCVYSALVFIARMLEAFVHYLAEGGVVGHGGFFDQLLGTFSWSHFVAVQLWIFVLFLVYVTGREFDHLFGDGELLKILFKRRSSELQSTRRARIRLLTRLSHLTERHPVEVLTDPASRPHAELLNLLRGLVSPRRAG